MRLNRLAALLWISLGLSGVALAAGAPVDGDPLHPDWIDTHVGPAQNFYQYANGGWVKSHPIPAAYSSWSTFHVLQIHNEKVIRQLIQAAANTHAASGSAEQKVGDFYASGMDEKLIDRVGVGALSPELDGIGGVRNLADLQREVAHLQMIGVDAMFGVGEMQDFKDSTRTIGVAGQGGIGLPDRDYYLKQDPKSKGIRAQYVAHVARTFQLLGDGQDLAAREAAMVMAIETSLARVSMSRVEQRNPRAIYHVMNLAELDRSTPNFSWRDYFREIGYPRIESINLAMPQFFAGLGKDLHGVPLIQWKVYLRWRLIDAFAPYLSQPFVDEDFRMQSALTGAQTLLPRWQRVVSAENDALGFAIGQVYVQKEFPPSSRAQVLEILHGIRAALRTDLATLSWMAPATRQAAIAKLDLMGERIGYPDKWRDYSALRIDRGPYVLNVMRANEFEQRRQLNEIGKPVDRSEWLMTPQEVNAYYDPPMNNINFPAGILQPPFFDPKAPAALNYGAIGWAMGHETTHGFDDEGSQFDGHGNLKNWWTPEDAKRFHAATGCISNQFSSYTVDGTLHLQGKLVTGEATADLGGLMLAWRAFHASSAYKNAKTIDGFTPDQQFFIGAAHVWADNTRPAEARRLVTIDPHAPALYRVNGTLANLPQFQQAFHIPANSPMVNAHRCAIW
ncbi:MAG TPA: M13 family metallopeptidase [Steroidobacteraceae bacterium]|jgi:putative endopeptidase|nr:M13 family metallopeptidase [Steroidobacteraceae bacterium]